MGLGGADVRTTPSLQLHGLASKQIRGSIVVSISACHAEDPGSIPGRGVYNVCPVARNHIDSKHLRVRSTASTLAWAATTTMPVSAQRRRSLVFVHGWLQELPHRGNGFQLIAHPWMP